MKKILYLYMAFLLVSCKDDSLNITPNGRITLDDVFSDEKRAEAYLNTAYASIPVYFYQYSWFSFLAGISDEAKDSDVGNDPGVMAPQWNVGALTPSYNPGPNLYSKFWEGIRHANVFLANIDKTAAMPAPNRARLKAEARLLRAFYYLELVKQFGPLPIFDEPIDVAFNYSSAKRPTFQEVTDFIVSDCNAAIAEGNLPIRLTVESHRGRFSKAGAYSIKSQILLYNASPLWNADNGDAKWTAAATAAKEALVALTKNGEYKLAADYGDYFLNQSDLRTAPADRETIFEVNSHQSGTITIINSIPSKASIKAGSCPSQELVDSYDMQLSGEPAILGYNDDDHLSPIINAASGYDERNPYEGRDPRFYATVWFNGAKYDNIEGRVHTIETFLGGSDQLIKSSPNRRNTQTGYYLRKFLDPKVQSNQPQNGGWKKFRLAEIYLNLAEAENEANGPTNDAYDAVNAIRARVSMPNLPHGLTKEQFRQRIRNERRVELAIEEHRFWDVRRWKILDKTDRSVSGIEITKNGDGSFLYKRFVTERRNAWQSKFLLFPLSSKEVAIVPDFNLNQNPGWN